MDRMNMPENTEPFLTTANPKRVHPVNPAEKTSYLNYDSIH